MYHVNKLSYLSSYFTYKTNFADSQKLYIRRSCLVRYNLVTT